MTERGSTQEGKSQQGSWWSRHTSVATRLAIAVLVVSIIPLLVSVGLTAGITASEGETALRGRLSAVRGSRTAELVSYAYEVENTVKAMASSRMVIEGVQAFAAARSELATITPEQTRVERESVVRFYLDEFVPALEEVRGEPVDVLQFDPGKDPATVHLQAAYLADNPLPIGEKHLVTDADDGSAWTEVHRELHPTLRAAVDRFAFEDLFLIDAQDRVVVYSTNKDAAFATDLDAGVHSGTTLARLADQVIETGEAGALLASDFAVYPPALDRPVAYVASPLVDDGEVVGVLAVGLPVDAINELMSRDWREGRRGETGEVYLVGPDLRMRSDSRAFIEDEAAYLERVEELGEVESIDRSRMAALGTTVLFQDVDTKATRAAVEGDEGFIADVSYLGRDVFTDYGPVDSDLFDWFLLVEEERTEVEEPIVRFIRDVLIITAVFVVAITFLAVAWANSFVDPLRAISAALVRIRQGDDHVAVPARGAGEFQALASDLDHMVVDLESRKSAVVTALESKVDILRTLLPPAAAERVGHGDRRLVETVSQATVVALVIDGLDEAFQGGDAEGNRELVHVIVDEADDLAAVIGLERVTLTGNVYYAVCGLNTPYVDHAPRSVTFALRVRDSLRRIAREHDLDVDVSAGINSGPVTTGLIGGSRLIYDLWGDTVDDAYRIGRGARTGQILVTESTRDRLPASTATDPVAVVPGISTWVVRQREAGGSGE